MTTDSRQLRIRIVSLFPQLFSSWLQQGVVSRAIAGGIVEVEIVDLRPYGVGRHHITDDYPFGGGPGMVLKPEPYFDCVASLNAASDHPIILLSPRGRLFDQGVAAELSLAREMLLLAGHYEGVDERVRQYLVTDEISIGDYVLSAGELAAMVVSDAIVRLIPGALARDSTIEESFSSGLLEYPQYTRPAEYRGLRVPEILLSGHHREIARWRRHQAIKTTARRRPDLLTRMQLTPEELSIVTSESGEGNTDSPY